MSLVFSRNAGLDQTTEMDILLLLQDWGEWYKPTCPILMKIMSDYWQRINTLKAWALEIYTDDPGLSLRACCAATAMLFFGVFHEDKIYNELRSYPERDVEEFFGEADGSTGIKLFHEYKDAKRAEIEATYVPSSTSAMYAFFYPATSTYMPLKMSAPGGGTLRN